MESFLRTPIKSFDEIRDFNYSTQYLSDVVDFDDDFKNLQIAYIDENKRGNNGTLLCIHGHPTWSYIWRHLVPIAVQKDFRVIALDLPGFGKSDKPLKENFFTFSNYRNVLLKFINKLNLQNINLLVHEWGGTLGLTLPMDNPKIFSSIVCFNSYLGNKSIKITESYINWINSNKENKNLNVRALMARTNRILNLAECNSYEAPFPDETYKLALQMLPKNFPISEDQDGYKTCIEAENWWEQNKIIKCIVIGSGRDPLIPLDKMKVLSQLISTEEVTRVINNAGHFVPEWGMEFGNELFTELKGN